MNYLYALKRKVSFSGVFALLNAYAALRYIQSVLSKSEFRYFFIISIIAAAGLVFITVVGLTWAGKLPLF